MNSETKLFIQLAPDMTGIDWLQNLQKTINPSSIPQLVDKSTLHMSILHIGKLERIINAIKGVSNCESQKIIDNAEVLADQLELVLKSYSNYTFSLQTKNTRQFGHRADIMACEFKTTPELLALHYRTLVHLRKFLGKCGIHSVDEFMLQDNNLRYALQLHPHVTIAKNCFSEPIQYVTKTINFTTMPVVYPQIHV